MGNLRRQLLGRPAIEAFDLVEHVGTVQNPESPTDKFPCLFNGLGKLEEEYSIKLQQGAKPYHFTVPRHMAVPLFKTGEAGVREDGEVGSDCQSQ